jgi:hypothetical protein
MSFTPLIVLAICILLIYFIAAKSKKKSPFEKYQAVEKKIKKAGSVDGKHYTGYVVQIKELKRLKKHDKAINLLFKLVDADEKEAKVSGEGVAPWYYEQLAIIFRKEKRYDDEVRILERYKRRKRAPGAKPKKLDERLIKARELRDKNK